jgi:hypothetical protein
MICLFSFGKYKARHILNCIFFFLKGSKKTKNNDSLAYFCNMSVLNLKSIVSVLGLIFVSTVVSNIQSQVSLGIIGGVNFTAPVATVSHDILQPGSRNRDGSIGKEYFSMFSGESTGGQFGLMANVPLFSRFSIDIQLLYFQYSFPYHSRYTWSNDLGENPWTLDQMHRHNIDYVELPVMLRMEILPNAVSPFIAAGGYLGISSSSNKFISSRFIASNEISQTEEWNGYSLSAEGSLREVLLGWNAGILGGGGVRYRASMLEVGIAAYYRVGLVQIVDASRRYTAFNSFSSNSYDAMDNTFLHNLSLNVYLVFPLGGGFGAPSRYGGTYCSFTRKKR